jgi:hypothetical protein
MQNLKLLLNHFILGRRIFNMQDTSGHGHLSFVLALLLAPVAAYAQLPAGVTFPNYQLATDGGVHSNTAPPSWTIDQDRVSIDDMNSKWINGFNKNWVHLPSDLFPGTTTSIICGPWAAVSDDGSLDKGASFYNEVKGLVKGRVYRYSFLAAGNKYIDYDYPLPEFPCSRALPATITIGFYFDGTLMAEHRLTIGSPAESVEFTFVAPKSDGFITIGTVYREGGCTRVNPWYNIAAGTGRFIVYEGCDANAGITTRY